MSATGKHPKAIYPALGSKLRRARKQKGLSQEFLADRIGVTRRHLIRLENGEHRPSVELRAAIAHETGVDADVFRLPDDDAEDERQMNETFELFRVLMDRLAAERKVTA